MNTLSIIRLVAAAAILGVTSMSYAVGETYNIRFANTTQNSYTIIVSVAGSAHIAYANINAINNYQVPGLETTAYFELHTGQAGSSSDATLAFSLYCKSPGGDDCGSVQCTFTGESSLRHSYSVTCSNVLGAEGAKANWTVPGYFTGSSSNLTVPISSPPK